MIFEEIRSCLNIKLNLLLSQFLRKEVKSLSQASTYVPRCCIQVLFDLNIKK